MHEPVKVEAQRPVPGVWRPTLRRVVEAIRLGDASTASNVPDVEPVPDDLATQILDSIAGYGERLVPLPSQTWDTSVTMWQRDYWEVLVDLFTEPGQRSDLVMHVEVRERGASYLYRLGPVYVP